MDMVEELLRQLDGWLDLQDCLNKDQSQSVLNQMINNHVKVSDAADYCRIVNAPEDTADLYERFLTYMQQQEEDDSSYDTPDNRDYLLDAINTANAKLDMILVMLESRG